MCDQGGLARGETEGSLSGPPHPCEPLGPLQEKINESNGKQFEFEYSFDAKERSLSEFWLSKNKKVQTGFQEKS